MKNIILNRTKIIATIGPASSSKKILHEIILSGVDAIRLNFSHGSHKYHKKVIQMVRALSEEMNTPISIIQDLQGPKIRIGKIKGSEIELKEGEELRIHSKDIIGTDKDISIINKDLFNDIKINERILIDDGKIQLNVISKNKTLIKTVVLRSGILKSNKGVNLPQTNILLSSITEKDKEDLFFGLDNEVDWIALSFVRSANDVKTLKRLRFRNSLPNSKAEKFKE